MSQKRILVLNGHPGETSLSRHFAERYVQSAAQSGADVRVHHLPEMVFDMDFGQGNYSQFKPLEPVLEAFLSDLEWAEHFVMLTPMWWGGLPAKLKGLFDRAFLPNRTFNTKVLKMGMPTPMLTGKTARVIMTSDTPRWFERLIYRNAIMRQLDKQILGFVGIKPVRYTYFSGASDATAPTILKWGNTVSKLGQRAA
ncbi:NAD(P)H dehydrogenase [Loktanella sp. 1ANDIMAR09]|uniref:Putative NADPH-quinone reductase (Modulator of drug activity B) n=1 Tax=Yoonia rosea TaxID=287098 RepID=A0A1R3XGJ3_9RHOB|nr:NAD(P)H-dependent oxidoreductase [Yoonia rosea]KQB95297.1 NAD(P)H dehydrogenase [Loktanella sp. 1ANDIMAR09]SIT89265.1 Putative NADPH-quinone reductase (modulator of drug activity B) [Yoonia rosea]